MEAIRNLADFIRCYNSVFMYLISQKKGSDNLNQEKILKATVESSKKRISDLGNNRMHALRTFYCHEL